MLTVFFAELIPSSARSTASAAQPLPPQLVPLLDDTLQKLKSVLGRVLPVSKPRNVLEEAEWEDEGGEDAGFEREMILQCTCLLSSIVFGYAHFLK